MTSRHRRHAILSDCHAHQTRSSDLNQRNLITLLPRDRIDLDQPAGMAGSACIFAKQNAELVDQTLNSTGDQETLFHRSRDIVPLAANRRSKAGVSHPIQNTAAPSSCCGCRYDSPVVVVGALPSSLQ
jgi:hypothetical protein